MKNTNLFNSLNLVGTISSIPVFKKYDTFTENGTVEVKEAYFRLDVAVDDAGTTFMSIPITCNTNASSILWNCFKKDDRVLVEGKINGTFNTWNEDNDSITVIEILATDIRYPADYGL